MPANPRPRRTIRRRRVSISFERMIRESAGQMTGLYSRHRTLSPKQIVKLRAEVAKLSEDDAFWTQLTKVAELQDAANRAREAFQKQ